MVVDTMSSAFWRSVMRGRDGRKTVAARERGVSSHARATAEALFVTFLWSTSWVLIKLGLPSIPPLTFAGLRYAMAFLCLAPAMWIYRREVRALGVRNWVLLGLLGVILYAVTQGGQFLTLAHLDATTFSLLLSFTAVVVALASVAQRRERPRALQWAGIGLAAIGAVVYFVPARDGAGSPLGFTWAGITVVANAAAALLGRRVNRASVARPIVVTAISMGVGAGLLLAAGFSVEGLPRLSPPSWGLIGWLAVVNTAVAFTLWNRSLRTLSAVESSVLNNTMLVQVAILAWLFLGETHGALGIAGLVLVALGTLLVQLRAGSAPPSGPPTRDGLSQRTQRTQ
jgi:drug/metabolite transporter (DMT)-like permease